MLIEKKQTVAVNDIISFRLLNGEEIIGKLVELDSYGTLTVTKPVVAQMQMISPSQAGLGFAPFMVTADESGKFPFPTDRLLSPAMKTRADIASKYIEATTGLQVPAAGLLKA